MDSFEIVFSRLIAAFAGGMGLELAAPSNGFEFESDGFVVRCLHHVLDEDRYLLEVDVKALEFAEQVDAGLLLLLHQLNESAMLITGWTVVVDAEHQILLRRSSPIALASPEQLQEEVCEAIERAEQLVQMLADAASRGKSNFHGATESLLKV